MYTVKKLNIDILHLSPIGKTVKDSKFQLMPLLAELIGSLTYNLF